MASAKEIKKKIRSIANTKKITRTMEMVSTVKAKRGQDRLKATNAYSVKVAELVRNLAGDGTVRHPLLGTGRLTAVAPDRSWLGAAAAKVREVVVGPVVGKPSAPAQREPAVGKTEPGKTEPGKTAAPGGETGAPGQPAARSLLIVITGNRGLCGGYNTNVLHMAERFLERERSAGRETAVVMIGKKGIARFRFRRIPVAKGITTIGDNPEWGDAEELSREFLPKFEAGEIDRVVVVGTRYFSSSRHEPLEIQLLPFPAGDPPIVPPGTLEALRAADSRPARARASGGHGEAGHGGSGEAPERTPEIEFIYEPDRAQVLEALIPVAVKFALYRILIEARASEHIARRVAMKTATDNAETMIRTYTTFYNRQRQAGITQQIVEVVSGADALD